MASLRDVAKEVGVSVSLVSKVLSEHGASSRISADTAAKVQAVASRLGYRKNMSAVSLLAGRHHVLGAYLHRIGAPGSGIMEELISGISTEIRQHNYSLLLNFFSTVAQFESLCASAHSGRMDGVLIGGLYHAGLGKRAEAIQRSGLPLVTVFSVPLAPGIPNVGVSETCVAELATRHLIEGGARSIAHIFNLPSRYEGFRAALAAAGLPFDERLVYGLDSGGREFGHRTGMDAAHALLGTGIPFDGIVAQSDNEAMGCLNVLLDAGIRVPDDVQVIGIDDAPFCQMARVPLSSVSLEFSKRGELAVRCLMSGIEGGEMRDSVVPPRLVVRESTRKEP